MNLPVISRLILHLHRLLMTLRWLLLWYVPHEGDIYHSLIVFLCMNRLIYQRIMLTDWLISFLSSEILSLLPPLG